MSGGPVQVFQVGVASGASTSSQLDLGGKAYTQFSVMYTTMSTGAQVAVWGAAASSTTYGPIYQQSKITATVQYNALTIATNVSGGWAVFDAPPFRYIQFITSAVVSGGVSYTVMVSD